MVRVTHAVATHRRKKRMFKRARGFIGDRKNHVRLTSSALMKAMEFHYRHRKHRKSQFRRLWIIRINTAARINGLSYNKFINGLQLLMGAAGLRGTQEFKDTRNSALNRKVLANMAIADPEGFATIANQVKEVLAAKAV